MQYQVPQFIETEDKVVGPFSLRQFLYVGAACGVSAISYFIVQTWLFLIIAFILIGGAAAFSFVKINGQSLTRIALSAFNFYWKPQTYVWKSPEQQRMAERAKPTPVVVEEEPTPFPVKSVAVPRPVEKVEKPAERPAIEKIISGASLHKSWQNLQTGTPTSKKTSDKQFVEKKMAERYQIFQRASGDRMAARRVDYR